MPDDLSQLSNEELMQLAGIASPTPQPMPEAQMAGQGALEPPAPVADMTDVAPQAEAAQDLSQLSDAQLQQLVGQVPPAAGPQEIAAAGQVMPGEEVIPTQAVPTPQDAAAAEQMEKDQRAMERVRRYEMVSGSKIAPGLMREIAQGATFGFADEGEAAIRAGATSGPVYEAELGKVREARAKFEEKHPFLSIGGQVAGMLTPGVGAAGAVGKALTLGQKILRSTAISSGVGALAGAGTAEGGTAERLEGGLMGGAMGAALGPIIPLAGVGLGATKNAISRMLGGGRKAEDVLADMGDIKTRAGEYMSKLEEGMQKGTDVNLADLSPAFAGLGRTLRKAGGEAQDIVEQNLNRRAARETERVANYVKRNVSDKPYFGNLDEVESVYGGMAKKAYDLAYSKPPLQSERLTNLITSRPTLNRAYTKAKEMAQDEGFRIADDIQRIDTKTADYMNKAINNMIEKETDTITGKISSEGVRFQKMKNEFLNTVDELNPDYKMARSIGGDRVRMREAQRFGTDYTRLSPEEIKRKMATMAPAEKEAAMVGLKERIMNEVQKSAQEGSGARRVFNKEFQKKQIKEFFGENQKAYGDFKKSMEGEIDAAKTYQRIMGGSQTDVNLAQGGQLQEGLMAASQGMGGVVQLGINKTANFIAQAYQGINRKNATLLARAVTDPEEGMKILRSMSNTAKGKQLGPVRQFVEDARSLGAFSTYGGETAGSAAAI